MKKFAAIACLMVVLVGLTAFWTQPTQMKKIEPLHTYVGVLEDSTESAVVVKSQEDKEPQLFWLAQGLSCSIPAGETVLITYTGDRNVENQVLTATSVELKTV